MIIFRYPVVFFIASLLLVSLAGQPLLAADPADQEQSVTAIASDPELLPADPINSQIRKLLADKPTATLGFTTIKIDPVAVDLTLSDLYEKNSYQPYWVTEQGSGTKADSLLSVLTGSAEEGLEPALYHIAELGSIWQNRDPESLARLDLMLTLAMAAYVSDMREGRAISCLLDPKLFAAARDKEVNLKDVVHQGLKTPDLVQFLQMQAPMHSQYQSLKKTLADYRKLAAEGGWPEIPEGKTLKPGMTDERLPLLIKRLSITGDLNPVPETVPLTYDDQLVEAVKHFQYRYNLEQDGVIGKNTLSALNIPVEDHVSKIILNLERWRWLPHILDGRRILVNIAGFQLKAIQNEKVEMQMPVIVGKVFFKTPVFSHRMTYLVINPFWNIPTSIARNEIVGKMAKDPSYLQSQKIRMFKGWKENAPEVDPASINWQTIGRGINSYRLRQDPGPGNALGRIKFMFPNSDNIYMHDTPTHSLFKRSKRSFSHGCIRVSKPIDLAEHILASDNSNWTKKRIKEVIASGKRQIIRLKNPWPVHILYRTVRIDPADGTVFFYDDVYGRDALLAEALFTDQPPVQCRYSYQ